MANLKFVVFVGLLLAFSLAISATASEDHEAQVQEVKPTGHVDQSNCGCGRRSRCCGACAFGTQCAACCPRKMVGPEEVAETEVEHKEAAETAVEPEKVAETEVEPQQSNCGCGRRRRCCGACAFGRCSACC